MHDNYVRVRRFLSDVELCSYLEIAAPMLDTCGAPLIARVGLPGLLRDNIGF